MVGSQSVFAAQQVLLTESGDSFELLDEADLNLRTVSLP